MLIIPIFLLHTCHLHLLFYHQYFFFHLFLTFSLLALSSSTFCGAFLTRFIFRNFPRFFLTIVPLSKSRNILSNSYIKMSAYSFPLSDCSNIFNFISFFFSFPSSFFSSSFFDSLINSSFLCQLYLGFQLYISQVLNLISFLLDLSLVYYIFQKSL